MQHWWEGQGHGSARGAGAGQLQHRGLQSWWISDANQGHAQSGPDRKAPSESRIAAQRRRDSGEHGLFCDSALNRQPSAAAWEISFTEELVLLKGDRSEDRSDPQALLKSARCTPPKRDVWVVPPKPK